MADIAKARERSVNNLQRLYTIVVSLAIAQTLRHLIEATSVAGLTNFPEYCNELFMFVSFIFIVVPFFHGANRYLDATYVTGERNAKHYALLIDFIALFVEGLALFGLGMVTNRLEVFYSLLAGLLVLDIAWVGSTSLTGEKETDKVPKFKKWAVINAIAMGGILISVWSNLWPGELIKNIMLVLIVMARTIYDYVSVWGFYYPIEKGAEQIPAPRPAPPPKHTTSRSSDSEQIRIMVKARINRAKLDQVTHVLKNLDIPPAEESANHLFSWNRDLDTLTNCYLAIVSICHQTSPIGERAVEGFVKDVRKHGWDYLKEKFLIEAIRDSKWGCVDFWKILTPDELANLYDDEICGKTLNRISERTFLINNLGDVLLKRKWHNIKQAFEACSEKIGGKSGFLEFLRSFEAYNDPLRKKSLFFLSIAANECKWEIRDQNKLLSPVDYHELRGHLRIGTVQSVNTDLQFKLEHGLPLTENEDTELRLSIQKVNLRLAKACGITSGDLHYLLWNVFRACCPRDSAQTHCYKCGSCDLPDQYKKLFHTGRKCIFYEVCGSVNLDDKIKEPPYIGHYY